MNKLLKIVIKQGNRRRDILSPNVFEFTSNKLVLLPSSKIQPHKPLLYQFKERLQLMFLPKDYPLSVTKEYLPYTIYNFFNSTLSTIIGTLSMQALLQALGASQSISIALSATTNWIIKDGVGLLGGVIYASSVSDKFDSHPKRYKFLSTLLIQISCVLELITPLFPVLFLPLASASNIGKNIGWLAVHLLSTFH